MTHKHHQRGNALFWILLLLIVGAGLVYYFVFRQADESGVEAPPPIPPAVITQEPEQSEPESPPERDSLPEPASSPDFEPEPAEPLPALVESDQEAIEAAETLVGTDAVRAHLVTEGVIPRLVAAIDALTGEEMPENILPIRSTPGEFEVTEDGVSETVNPETGLPEPLYVLDAANFDRYRGQVEILEAMDTGALMESFRHYYPLLQESYRELGYPQGEFEARLVEVIDHLVATPDPERPVRLVKPEAFYEFADPELEALSAGQKILIRIGPSNAARVKAKLREIRDAIQTQRE